MCWSRSRRHIALTNLRLCLPELSEAERRAVARRHFQDYARAVLERGILWWAPPARLQRLIQIEPAVPLELIGAGPLIFLCPHFVCLDVAASALAQIGPGCSIYTRQKSRVFDRALLRGRTRFHPIQVFSRDQGIKPILRAMRENLPFMMLPDMDFGSRDAAFVPFFGMPAATLTAPARIAGLTGATVVPVVATFLPDYRGWKVRVLSALAGLSGQRRAGRDAPHERLHRGARARSAGRIFLDPQALQDASAGHGRCLPSAKTPCLSATGSVPLAVYNAGMKLKFTKMHGAGNDFVVIDAIRQQVELTPEQCRRLADRRFGIGADQILVVEAAPAELADVDFRYRIYNADGGEVEQCGNGARAFARFVAEHGLSTKRTIRVATLGGVIAPTLEDGEQVTVDMGVPLLEAAQVPFDAAGLQAATGGRRHAVAATTGRRPRNRLDLGSFDGQSARGADRARGRARTGGRRRTVDRTPPTLSTTGQCRLHADTRIARDQAARVRARRRRNPGLRHRRLRGGGGRYPARAAVLAGGGRHARRPAVDRLGRPGQRGAHDRAGGHGIRRRNFPLDSTSLISRRVSDEPDAQFEFRRCRALPGGKSAFFRRTRGTPVRGVRLTSPVLGRAVSLQERQMEVLREKIRTQELHLAELLRVAQDNDAIGVRFQDWTRALLQARNDVDLPHVLTSGLQSIFSVPHATLRLWNVAPAFAHTWFAAPVSEDARIFSNSLDAPFCGPNHDFEVCAWLEDATPVQSVALLPLRSEGGSGETFGLLLLGSPDPARFGSNMATDFLSRIGITASAALA